MSGTRGAPDRVSTQTVLSEDERSSHEDKDNDEGCPCCPPPVPPTETKTMSGNQVKQRARVLGILMPCVVVGLVAYASYVFCGLICVNALIRSGRTAAGSVLLSFYLFFLVLATCCFASARLAPSSSVHQFPHLSHETITSQPIYQCDAFGGPRWCSTCNKVKPDRSHHCNETGDCILKQDHYCVFIGSNISFTTHKAFVQFVTYMFLLCLWTLIGTSVIFAKFHGLAHRHLIGCWISLIAISAFFSPIFGAMAITHVYFVLFSLSSFDSRDHSTRTYTLSVQYAPHQRAIVTTSPGERLFHLGYYNNWVSTMGPHLWQWLFPIPTVRPDQGLHFQYNPKLIPRWTDQARANGSSFAPKFAYPPSIDQGMIALSSNERQPGRPSNKAPSPSV